MNSADVSGFFYNLIPGSLFIVGVNLLGYNAVDISLLKVNPESTREFIGFMVFIIYALFLGFVFQGVIKIFREIILNKAVFSVVRWRNESQYKVAKDILRLVDKKEGSPKDAFYLMDDFLRGNQAAAGPIHFSSRFAFWSNMLVASAFFLVLIKLVPYTQSAIYLNTVSEIIFIFSLIISPLYFYAYYDVVLKTFITKIKLQNTHMHKSR